MTQLMALHAIDRRDILETTAKYRAAPAAFSQRGNIAALYWLEGHHGNAVLVMPHSALGLVVTQSSFRPRCRAAASQEILGSKAFAAPRAMSPAASHAGVRMPSPTQCAQAEATRHQRAARAAEAHVAPFCCRDDDVVSRGDISPRRRAGARSDAAKMQARGEMFSRRRDADVEALPIRHL